MLWCAFVTSTFAMRTHVWTRHNQRPSRHVKNFLMEATGSCGTKVASSRPGSNEFCMYATPPHPIPNDLPGQSTGLKSFQLKLWHRPSRISPRIHEAQRTSSCINVLRCCYSRLGFKLRLSDARIRLLFQNKKSSRPYIFCEVCTCSVASEF